MKDIDLPEILAIIVVLTVAYVLVAMFMGRTPTCSENQVAVRSIDGRTICVIGYKP